jgi:peptide/nickel transport system permease protein
MAAESPALEAREREPLWRARLRLLTRSGANGWAVLTESRSGALGLGAIAFYALIALLHPMLMTFVWDPAVYDPVVGYGFGEALHPAPPSLAHLLGTDPQGRDVLSQLMYGARTAFGLGLVASLATAVIGTAVGAASAYFGRWVDGVLMRLADLAVMTPAVSFFVVLGALVNLSIVTLGIAIGALTGFGAAAIVIKSQALALAVKPYMDAARAVGGGHLHILVTHLIPSLLPLSLLYMMFTVTAAVFSEAVLSFFGILDLRMSWGIMVHTAQSSGYLVSGPAHWWLLVPAGLSISLFCGAFYLVGRAMDGLVDPRLRRGR